RGAWALAYLDLAAGRHREAAVRLRTATWNGHGQGHLVIQVMATPQFVEAAARIVELDEAHAALEVFERWVSSTRSPDRLALAASGESVRPRQRATTADLTPQQLQIARLVAAGATNREIAGRLCLSHRTVEHHLSKIFTKLEIRSRVELAKLL